MWEGGWHQRAHCQGALGHGWLGGFLPPAEPSAGLGFGVAFQAPPGSQASSRGEAKDFALLSSHDAGLLEPPRRSAGRRESASRISS